MNTSSIDKAFREMIGKRCIHTALGTSSGAVRLLRFYLKKGQRISLDKQLQLLKKPGWTESPDGYTRADMMAFAKYYHRSSQAAKEHGPEYLLEKWENKAAPSLPTDHLPFTTPR